MLSGRSIETLNILIISQYFWPENFRINDLVQELVERGHAVTVLTGLPNYPSGHVFEDYQRAPETFNSYKGASIVRVPLLSRGAGGGRLILNYASFVLSAATLGVWHLRGKTYDIVFVFEPSPVTVGLPAVLLGWMKRAPVIFWALDLWPETLAAVGTVKSPRILALVGGIVRFIYSHCTLVLGQSRGFLPKIAKYCSDTSKIRYFPSWAEDVFAEQCTQLAPEVEHRAGLFNVLFAGNIGEAQDMPAVLDAAQYLKTNARIRWLIVGDGRRLEWVRQEVKRRGLGDRVLLLGRFPINRMPSFYAHADALLVSLKSDPIFSMTIPGKVQSYLLAGVPLLGMLDGEGAAVIREAGAGMVCPAGDGRALANTVMEMASLPKDERVTMGRQGALYAQKEFSRSVLIDRLEAMFNEVIQQQPRKSAL